MGNEIDTAMGMAGADFANVHQLQSKKPAFQSQAHSGYWRVAYILQLPVWRAKKQNRCVKTVVICIATSVAMFTAALAETPAQWSQHQWMSSIIYAPRIQYPPEARSKHIQGSGVFMLHINREGLVTKVDVSRSTGSPILDNAALSALRQWRFRPPKPPVLAHVQHDFRLQ